MYLRNTHSKKYFIFSGILERFVVTESFPKLAFAVEEEDLWYFSISFNSTPLPARQGGPGDDGYVPLIHLCPDGRGHLPLALTWTVLAVTLAVITDVFVVFAVVFVFLVVALVAVVSSNQNFTRLKTGQRVHGCPAIRSAASWRPFPLPPPTAQIEHSAAGQPFYRESQINLSIS